MSCGVGRRHSSDLMLLWHRLATIAPIRPLAWEPPYAVGVALAKKKKVFKAFWAYFCVWCEGVFYLHWCTCKLSSFRNTIYWRNCPFSIVYSSLLCQRLIEGRCGFISGLSIMSHWSLCLFQRQYHDVLLTIRNATGAPTVVQHDRWHLESH